MPRSSAAPSRRASTRTRKQHTADPAYVEPMKALGVAELPPGPWLTEVKLDGFRALGIVQDGRATLWSRNQRDISERFPEVTAAVAALACDNAIVDGEIVALDPEGRSRFQLLQRGEAGRFYYVFDLLHRDGRSLLGEPIEERKRQLEQLLKGANARIRLSAVLDAQPRKVLAEVARRGLEGVVLKRPGSLYEPGRRSGAWIKKRVSLDQEFVIGGYTEPAGSRSHFGAILVGYYDRGRLRYAGKVGTGFNHALLASLHRQFQARRTDASPFSDFAARKATWLRPEMVAQIKFSEWTQDGLLRQPVFLGLREDKRAAEVVRES